MNNEVVVKMLKGMLEVIILQMLDAEPIHGYGIISRIRKKFGVYFGPSTIYPMLTRMEKQGYVKSQWSMDNERPRKVYAITDSGRALLVESCTGLQIIIKPLALVPA